MIFATVGTTHFDALTRTVDEAVGGGLIGDDTIIQIGYGGNYVPRRCRYFRLAPTLRPFEQSASLIVGHGGTGTTLEILRMGKPLISVSNPELCDNHQHEFLEALEAVGLVTYCRNLHDLPALLVAPPHRKFSIDDRSTLAAAIAQQLNASLRRPWRFPLLARLAEHVARGAEIDVASTVSSTTELSLPDHLVIDPRR